MVLIVSFVVVFCVCGDLGLLVSCLGLCYCGFLQLAELFGLVGFVVEMVGLWGCCLYVVCGEVFVFEFSCFRFERGVLCWVECGNWFGGWFVVLVACVYVFWWVVVWL